MRKNASRLIILFLASGFTFGLMIMVSCQSTRFVGEKTSETSAVSITPTLTARSEHTRIYPGPIETPATPIPDPFQSIKLHEEVESIVLLGLDQDFPFSGRTDAIYLILYNYRTGMASVISIPPDLLVYIPGYTMQRINVAYPVGGVELVRDTLEYNFGINPNHYLIIQFSDFPRLIDAIGGIDVVVTEDLTDPCLLAPGSIHMNGDQAFCYAILRRGEDDIDRNRRQLQVMRAFFLRSIVGGQIARLPELYAEFQNSIQTDLTLMDLVENLPLAIRLADPQHVSYYQISWDEVIQWIMPGRAKTLVLLPKRDPLRELIQAAVANVMSSAPVSDLVITLQVQLTRIVLSSFTPTPSVSIPTITVTPGPTNTPGIPTNTMTVVATPTPTTSIYPYP